MYAQISADPQPTPKSTSAIQDSARLSCTPVTSTFYINRDCEESRCAFIEFYMREAEIDGERIAAVEGLAVPQSLAHFFFNGDKQCSRLSPAEVGCYASHLMVARIVVARGLEHALILEDDAEFAPNLTQSVKDVLAHLPADWDLVHLYGNEAFATKPVAQLEHSRTLVRYSRVPRGTVAYLISRRGAEKFLAPKKRIWPIDTDLRQPWRFGLQIYGLTPALVDHTGRFPSAIARGSKGERSRMRRGLPLPSRHCRTGNPLHTPHGLYFNLTTLGLLWWARCWLQNTKLRAVRMLFGRRRARKRVKGVSSSEKPVSRTLA